MRSRPLPERAQRAVPRPQAPPGREGARLPGRHARRRPRQGLRRPVRPLGAARQDSQRRGGEGRATRASQQNG